MQNIFQLFETMCYQFFRKESTLFTPKHAFRINSPNIIGRTSSMVIPLLANQDLAHMLSQYYRQASFEGDSFVRQSRFDAYAYWTYHLQSCLATAQTDKEVHKSRYLQV